MRESALSAILLLAIVKTILLAISLWPPDKQPRLYRLKQNNSEALLASGHKLNFYKIGIYDLQLIPGVGDQLARSILEKRPQILACFNAKLSKVCPANPFELVKGVGSKTAAKLSTYIHLNQISE